MAATAWPGPGRGQRPGASGCLPWSAGLILCYLPIVPAGGRWETVKCHHVMPVISCPLQHSVVPYSSSVSLSLAAFFLTSSVLAEKQRTSDFVACDGFLIRCLAAYFPNLFYFLHVFQRRNDRVREPFTCLTPPTGLDGARDHCPGLMDTWAGIGLQSEVGLQSQTSQDVGLVSQTAD